jgi:thiamine-monophosphate kinase
VQAPGGRLNAAGAPTSDGSRLTVGDISERELIGRIRCRLPPPPSWLAIGIGDDASVIEPERNRLDVLTVDSVVEGIHFDRAFTPPDAIGHRALAVNLSDLAAMGAAPRVALLSMALPASLPLADFDAITAGLIALAARYRVHLAGGNLTRSPGPLMLDVTVAGTVKRRRALTRGGARAGDELYVSGVIGAAVAGHLVLRQVVSLGDLTFTDDDRRLVSAFLYPEPRVRLGTLLGRNRAASACMDLSDGLADAVRQVAEASGVGAIIEAAALPIDDAARGWFSAHDLDPIATAIGGGDDYELLVGVAPAARRRFTAAARQGGAPLTRIGVCTEDPALVLRRDGADTPLHGGFTHFAS